MRRLPSVDIARGFVMVIMALDHVRDLLHVTAQTESPTNMATTTPILFFTRWITHICAPSFVFLSGVSAWLAISAAASKPAPNKLTAVNGPASTTFSGPLSNPSERRFLLTRGIWLILLELTVVNFGFAMDLHFRLFIFEVIATIGSGFILLSFISRLSLKVISLLAFLLFFGHDLLTTVQAPSTPVLRFLASLFLAPGGFQPTSNTQFIVAYPILPWLGIMLAGYVCGRLFQKPVEERKKLFIRIGSLALCLFVLLRAINSYGDPAQWSVQKNNVFTVLSFLNVSKYPPSLLFSLVTLGILFIVLAIFEGRDNRLTRFLLVYGKVPLFYFLVHIYLIHLLLFAMVFLQGFHPADMAFGPFQFGRPLKGSGVQLPAIYGIWVFVVLALYPLCRWYGKYKTAHREKTWLRYL